MAKAKTKKTVTRKAVTVKLRAAKIPKITSIAAVNLGDGVTMCYGLGVDNRIYSWQGAVPAGWALQEFTPPTAEQIADMLQKQQDEANAKNAPVPLNRAARRAAEAKAPAADKIDALA